MDDLRNKLSKKKFTKPDERIEFKSHGHIDLLKFEENVIGKAVFKPGWRWSNDVRPLVETDSCEVEHTGYCLKGSMTVLMDDGETLRIKEGEAFYIPAGHNAWVEGSEPCELLDFSGARTYARRQEILKKTG